MPFNRSSSRKKTKKYSKKPYERNISFISSRAFCVKLQHFLKSLREFEEAEIYMCERERDDGEEKKNKPSSLSIEPTEYASGNKQKKC